MERDRHCSVALSLMTLHLHRCSCVVARDLAPTPQTWQSVCFTEPSPDLLWIYFAKQLNKSRNGCSSSVPFGNSRVTPFCAIVKLKKCGNS